MFGRFPSGIKDKQKDVEYNSTFVQYLYCQFNRFTGETLYYHLASNPVKAILNILNTTTVPLTMSDLLCLGKVTCTAPMSDNDDGSVNPLSLDNLSFEFYSKPKIIPWSACKLPEDEAASLAPLGLSADETKLIVESQLKKFER